MNFTLLIQSLPRSNAGIDRGGMLRASGFKEFFLLIFPCFFVLRHRARDDRELFPGNFWPHCGRCAGLPPELYRTGMYRYGLALNSTTRPNRGALSNQ